MNQIKRGLYQHYRGDMYEVIGLALHEETHQPLVIYRALYGDYGMWARDLARFQETVEVEGKTMPRFTFIKPLGEEPPLLR